MKVGERKMEEIGSLQTIISGLRLENIIDKEFLNQLNKKYADKFDVKVSELGITLLPKEESVKPETQEKGKLTLIIGQPPSLKLLHRSEDDYQKGIVVVTSQSDEIIKRFLK